MSAWLMLAHVAVAQATPDTPQRFSVLAVPCASDRRTSNDDVVVCGTRLPGPRLPLPDDRAPPDRPLPSNPDADGMGAARAAVTPCAARMEGCQVGVDIFGAGTALVRALGKVAGVDSCCEDPDELTNPFRLIGDIVRAGGRRGPSPAERARRVAIPMDPDVPMPMPPAPAVAATPPAP